MEVEAHAEDGVTREVLLVLVLDLALDFDWSVFENVNTVLLGLTNAALVEDLVLRLMMGLLELSVLLLLLFLLLFLLLLLLLLLRKLVRR